MTGPDDWKGEANIRARPTRDEQKRRGQAAVQSVIHEKRRKEGVNAGQSGEPWARSIHAWAVSSTIEGKK